MINDAQLSRKNIFPFSFETFWASVCHSRPKCVEVVVRVLMFMHHESFDDEFFSYENETEMSSRDGD